MAIKLALAGNPNCGKTTMFNDLTGSSQYVGNWPGVTVEKKEGRLKGYNDVVVTDLPGIYSLSPYTLEEVVTRDYILHEQPDVIINLVDGSNIERNLYLTTQLTEMGIPVIVALNMMDIVRKNNDKIDVQKLSAALGCTVIETSAIKGEGLKALAEHAVAMAKSNVQTQPQHRFSDPVEKALGTIAQQLGDRVSSQSLRWHSIKLFERDEKAMQQLALPPETMQQIEAVTATCEQQLDDDSESIITNERYTYITALVQSCVKKSRSGMTASDKIDQLVTNRWLALPIFAAVMFVVYYVSVSWLGTIVTDWANDTLFAETIQPAATALLEGVGASAWLVSLVVDGIIGGVGAVLGFVPQMFILFFFLSILEDCGYMARVAFIMDRIFRKFGLSGKSFIPMLISSGCGVPGVMSTRTIENEKDRRMTIITTTFIPCGAKLPIIALIAGAVFPEIVWMGPATYFFGIFMVVTSGIILKKTKMFAGDPAPFVMELPQYHLPAAKGVLLRMWERGKAFIVKAGTVIFVACGVIWFLQNFGFGPEGFGMVEDQDASLLAAIGGVFAPLFAPLGFGNWRATVASITGLVAKENVIATFGVLFGLGEVAEDDPALLAALPGIFATSTSALAFMVFNLTCAPCFAAIGAIRREMNSAKWTWFAIGYMTGMAYVMGFIINQLGGWLFCGVGFGVGQLLAMGCIAVLLWLLCRKPSLQKPPRVSAATPVSA